ncbi:hypothetical protein D9M71_658390 [compost metagenome]
MLSALDGFLIQDQPQVFRLGGHVCHALATFAQQGNQRSGVAGHRFEVEGHFLLRQAGLLQGLHIEAQGLGSGQLAELFGRDTNIGRNVLEEVEHGPAARLQELAHAVVHVLEDVGELVLFDAY